jgi:hypothetical protein
VIALGKRNGSSEESLLGGVWKSIEVQFIPKMLFKDSSKAINISD